MLVTARCAQVKKNDNSPLPRWPGGVEGVRSGPGPFLWGKGGEEKNTCTKRGEKGKPARTTQRPRAGITNSNLKKLPERVGGRGGGGAAQVRVGGSRLLPPLGARGGDPSSGPGPTWDPL